MNITDLENRGYKINWASTRHVDDRLYFISSVKTKEKTFIYAGWQEAHNSYKYEEFIALEKSNFRQHRKINKLRRYFREIKNYDDFCEMVKRFKLSLDKHKLRGNKNER